MKYLDLIFETFYTYFYNFLKKVIEPIKYLPKLIDNRLTKKKIDNRAYHNYQSITNIQIIITDIHKYDIPSFYG